MKNNLTDEEEELLDRIVEYIKQIKNLTNKHEYFFILKEIENKIILQSSYNKNILE